MILLAVALVFSNSIIWHSSLALVLSRPAVQRAYMQHLRTLNRVSALLIGALGAKLIVSTLQEIRQRFA